jgi:hypothetical protein
MDNPGFLQPFAQFLNANRGIMTNADIARLMITSRSFRGSGLVFPERVDVTTMVGGESWNYIQEKVKNMILRNNGTFMTLPPLGSNVTWLEITNISSLESIPALESSPLKKLTLRGLPQLMDISSLPNTLVYLSAHSLDSIVEFPELSHLPLEDLGLVIMPMLREIPSLPSTIRYLRIIHMLEVSILPSMVHLSPKRLIIETLPNVTRLPEFSFENLESITISSVFGLRSIPDFRRASSLRSMTLESIWTEETTLDLTGIPLVHLRVADLPTIRRICCDGTRLESFDLTLMDNLRALFFKVQVPGDNVLNISLCPNLAFW